MYYFYDAFFHLFKNTFMENNNVNNLLNIAFWVPLNEQNHV